MDIPMVPFEGRMSYCLTRALAMVLAHQGHAYPVPWLEVVSGEPFGFVYVRDRADLFAIDGFVYHEAGQHLLRTLNFPFTYTGSADDASAVAALGEALRAGPVAVGMLDMGYLTYFPDHQSMRGADHAIVVLALQTDPDQVIVHDPAGFVAVPLALTDFLEAWRRDVYTGVPYGLWQIGARGEAPTDDEIWRRTLDRARANLARERATLPGDVTLCYGPEGMRTLADDLRATPERPLGALPYFNWRVSAQRCFDSAVYLRERLPEAGAIRWEEAQLYGRLQQASTPARRAALPDILERLADAETRFIAALG